MLKNLKNRFAGIFSLVLDPGNLTKDEIFYDDYFLIASFLDPNFKLFWIDALSTDKYNDEIKKNLSYNSNFIKKVENSRYKKILENKGVSIHVRRTDYLQSNGYHPIQPISYYEKGLEIIGEYDSIYVFSDDIEWCKKNIKFNNTIFVEGFDDIEDLWMMDLN